MKATVKHAKPHIGGCPGIGHALSSELENLCDTLRELPEIKAKRAIRHAAVSYDGCTMEQRYAMPGDDCAAFKSGSNYQLLAMEGMLPAFVESDPRAAGWSSVMVNISDIAAMGGRAQAIVNAFWHNNDEQAKELLFHIKRACSVFGLHFAGGHSSIQQQYSPNLAVAISGFANNLLSCHHLKPGQRLFLLTDLTGSWHGDLPYWGCVMDKSPEQIKTQWQVPAMLADEGLVDAAKDISNGGILGTLIMMLELTACGANIDLNAIPKPQGELIRWLRAFQSFGFLLAVNPEKTPKLLRFFNRSTTAHLSCAPIGSVNNSGKIQLSISGTTADFWDIQQEPLTYMGADNASSALSR